MERLSISKFLIIILISSFSFGQTTKQEKMKELSFMIGEWIGTSTSFKDEKPISKVSAFENIQYKLDQNIITIDLDSETLQLHTVIYYDETEAVYYYNPFYKNGATKYKAKYIDGKLIVMPSETKRFIFTTDEKGNFLEYGENLVDEKWVKYFEDTFTKSN